MVFNIICVVSEQYQLHKMLTTQNISKKENGHIFLIYNPGGVVLTFFSTLMVLNRASVRK